VEKYFTAGKATDENMAHAHCMLDTSPRLCNNHCFSAAKWWRESAALCLAAAVCRAGTSVGHGGAVLLWQPASNGQLR